MAMIQQVGQWMTTRQLAIRMNTTTKTIREWAKRNRIPVVRISPKSLRFDWDEVAKALGIKTEKN